MNAESRTSLRAIEIFTNEEITPKTQFPMDIWLNGQSNESRLLETDQEMKQEN
jgi:hypothetical protein